MLCKKILIIAQIEFQMMKYESFIGGIHSQSSWEPPIYSFLYPLQPNNNFLNQTISIHEYYAFCDVLCQYIATFLSGDEGSRGGEMTSENQYS